MKPIQVAGLHVGSSRTGLSVYADAPVGRSRATTGDAFSIRFTDTIAEAIIELLQRGASRELRDAEGRAARDVAIESGSSAVVALLG